MVMKIILNLYHVRESRLSIWRRYPSLRRVSDDVFWISAVSRTGIGCVGRQ
jgi:hypothetical protein